MPHSLLLFTATMYIVPFNTKSFVCLCIEIVLNVLLYYRYGRDKQLQTTPAGVGRHRRLGWNKLTASVALVCRQQWQRIATGQKYTDAVIRIALTLNSLDLRGFMNWMDHHRRVFSRNVLKWELIFRVGIRKKSKKIIGMYTLDILFSSNHNIHKSLCGLSFWASDSWIERL